MSVFLYSGKDLYRMQKNFNELLAKNEIDHDHVIVFDGADKKNFRLEAALMECGSYSLFDEDNRKAVIIKNAYFLTRSGRDTEKIQKTDTSAAKSRKEKEAAKKEGDFALLENYLKSADTNTMLVFYFDGSEADSRKKEYKLLQKYGVKIMLFAQMNERDFDLYLTEQLKKNGFHLTEQARTELKQRVDIDTMKLHNAFEKMELYGEKELNEEDIKHIVPMNSTVNAFKIASAFIQGNLAETVKARDEMLTFNYDYNSMIAMIAARLRSLYNMKHLYENGLNEENIAVRLHANPWAVKFGLQDCYGLKADTILSYLNELAVLDQGIKAGLIEPKDGFDTFLLRNGKRN